MRRSLVISLVAAVAAALCVGFTTASAAPSAGAGRDPDRLDAYTAVVQADELSAISEQGIEVSGARPVAGGIELDMVLDRAQADQLRGRGVELKLTRVKGGKTVRQFAAEQAANGFTVWRSYDEPGGIRDQLYAAAREEPPAGEARGPRPHRPGSRDHRGQADPGRPGTRTARARPCSTAPPSTRASGSRPRSTGG